MQSSRRAVQGGRESLSPKLVTASVFLAMAPILRMFPRVNNKKEYFFYIDAHSLSLPRWPRGRRFMDQEKFRVGIRGGVLEKVWECTPMFAGGAGRGMTGVASAE
jgi:hypothetical protein